MKALVSYRMPPRDETVVTLYDEHFIEITQTTPLGEEEDAVPVRIDIWDLEELIELLDRVRHYKPSVPEMPPEPPKPPLESMSVAPAKKKGPRKAD